MPQSLNHWDDDPDLWNQFLVNGSAVPGVATVECSKGRKLEVKSPPGSDGARVQDKGLDAAKFKVTLVFWTSDHWDRLQSFLDENFPRTSATTREPVDVFHPALAVLCITTAYLAKVDGPKPASVSGAMQITLEFVEVVQSSSSQSRSRRAAKTGDAGDKSNATGLLALLNAFDFGAEDP